MLASGSRATNLQSFPLRPGTHLRYGDDHAQNDLFRIRPKSLRLARTKKRTPSKSINNSKQEGTSQAQTKQSKVAITGMFTAAGLIISLFAASLNYLSHKLDIKLVDTITELEGYEYHNISDNVEVLKRLHSFKSEKSAHYLTDKDIHWIKSDESYGQHGNNSTYRAGYRTFDELNYRKSLKVPVPQASAESERIEKHTRELASLSYAYMVKQHGNPKLMKSPSENQLERIALLREYIYRTTGIPQNYDICLYEAKAPVAFFDHENNILALNVLLFEEDFYTTLKILFHEIAHNAPLRFGSPPLSSATQHESWDFMRTLESLNALTMEKLETIADKLAEGEDLSLGEKSILEAREKWETLRDKE